jgi:hypothetical protein
MTTAGPEQTLFVVASTDLERSQIMLTRIREQMDKLPDLKACGSFELSAVSVPSSDLSPQASLEQQVEEVAKRVTEIARASLGSTLNPQEQPCKRNN